MKITAGLLTEGTVSRVDVLLMSSESWIISILIVTVVILVVIIGLLVVNLRKGDKR